MAKKSNKKSNKSKDINLLQKHPQVENNAYDYFNHENGKTIIEDRVPRGDQDPWTAGQPINQGALTNEDLQGLAVYAMDLLDPLIARYDEETAREDALRHAINEKDGGKYAGKLSANTFKLLTNHMEKQSSAKKSKKIDLGHSNNDKCYTGKDSKSKKKTSSMIKNEEDRMSKTEEIKELESKLAALKIEQANKGMRDIAVKVASDPEARKLFKKFMKEAASKKKKDDEDDGKDACTTKYSDKKSAEDTSAEEATEEQFSVIQELDKIAGELESEKDFELFKIAYQIDKISDVLEGKKEASTLESDSDEKYMKQYFQAGKREGDADENKYMNEFNTDVSSEVEGVVGKKASTEKKESSERRPYSII